MAILITWNDTNSIEHGHRIFRSTSPMDPEDLPEPLVEVGPDVTEYLDTTAEPEVTYFYRVAVFLNTLSQVGGEFQITAAPPGDPTKLMLSLDVLEQGLGNNLLLSGDAQSGSDLLLI